MPSIEVHFDAVERCKRYRRRIIELSQQVPAIHIAPAFSCLEIVDTIYHYLMKPQDTFLMSKGHGVFAQYVVLEDLGILQKSDLSNYCRPGGILGGHPDYGVPGIAASTGSLGHGLGMAVGMAYADKLLLNELEKLGQPYTHDDTGVPRVFCLISDGELQEGSTWEAVMMAANLKLGTLVVFVDNNDFGGLSRMSEQHKSFYPLLAKFEAFGWRTALTQDGNASGRIEQAYDVCVGTYAPACIVCETVKGKGVSYMENNPIWHYRSPNKDEYAKAMEELA